AGLFPTPYLVDPDRVGAAAVTFGVDDDGSAPRVAYRVHHANGVIPELEAEFDGGVGCASDPDAGFGEEEGRGIGVGNEDLLREGESGQTLFVRQSGHELVEGVLETVETVVE